MVSILSIRMVSTFIHSTKKKLIHNLSSLSLIAAPLLIQMHPCLLSQILVDLCLSLTLRIILYCLILFLMCLLVFLSELSFGARLLTMLRLVVSVVGCTGGNMVIQKQLWFYKATIQSIFWGQWDRRYMLVLQMVKYTYLIPKAWFLSGSIMHTIRSITKHSKKDNFLAAWKTMHKSGL
jgi:hypothetical protein